MRETLARTLASLHRIAFESPHAAEQRLLCSNGERSLIEISRQLMEEFPAYRRKLPKRELPNVLVRMLAHFDEVISFIVDDLEKSIEYDCTPAKQLGWQPRSVEEAITAGAKSLIDLKLV